MEKKVKYARISMLVISIIYFCLAILAIISEFSVNTNDTSVGQFSFGALVSIAWWPVLIVALMVIAFILYGKKQKYGAIIIMLCFSHFRKKRKFLWREYRE